jgi:HPr kinase/phosphorylase
MTGSVNSCHAVLLVVAGGGLLITGAPGTGKSTLALELLRRGHQLVADDVVDLQMRDGRLFGSSPPPLSGLLHLRTLGLVDLHQLYGPHRLHPGWQQIDVAIVLAPRPKRLEDALVQGHWDTWVLAGKSLPRLWLDPRATPFMATLAETAARSRRAPAESFAGRQACQGPAAAP